MVESESLFKRDILSQLRPLLHSISQLSTDLLEEYDLKCRQFLGKLASRHVGALLAHTTQGAKGIFFSSTEDITPQIMNALLSLSSGVLLAAVSSERAQKLHLSHLPVASSLIRWGVPYASIEASDNITTGISASDRAVTLGILGAKVPESEKLVSPGHIFPFSPQSEATFIHFGFVEAVLQVMQLAGRSDCAVFIEALGEEGDYLSTDDIYEKADKLSIPVLEIEHLLITCCRSFAPVVRAVETRMCTKEAADLRSFGYTSQEIPGDHLVIMKGDVSSERTPLVWIHRENIRDDAFGTDLPSGLLSPRSLLLKALAKLENEENGIILYLRDDRVNEFVGPELYDSSALSLPYDALAALILKDLDVSSIRLWEAGNDGPRSALPLFFIRIAERVVL